MCGDYNNIYGIRGDDIFDMMVVIRRVCFIICIIFIDSYILVNI